MFPKTTKALEDESMKLEVQYLSLHPKIQECEPLALQ